MTAEECVRAGLLDEAFADLQQRIRQQPSESRLRIFLFQLLVVRGQWDRALTQLKVAAEMDGAAVPMLRTYQEALRCEVLRADVFAGRRTPLLFGEPPEWLALLIQALTFTADSQMEQASALRARAFDAAPATTGQVDGQPFEWIADADSRLGPVLEAIINGRYYWIPFNRLREIRMEAPADLRDVVWMPAQLTFANEGETVALIPSRYPGTESSGDSRLMLARATEWAEHPGPTYFGRGQRLLATNQGEYPLMDVRAVQLVGDVTAPG